MFRPDFLSLSHFLILPKQFSDYIFAQDKKTAVNRTLPRTTSKNWCRHLRTICVRFAYDIAYDMRYFLRYLATGISYRFRNIVFPAEFRNSLFQNIRKLLLFRNLRCFGCIPTNFDGMSTCFVEFPAYVIFTEFSAEYRISCRISYRNRNIVLLSKCRNFANNYRKSTTFVIRMSYAMSYARELGKPSAQREYAVDKQGERPKIANNPVADAVAVEFSQIISDLMPNKMNISRSDLLLIPESVLVVCCPGIVRQTMRK